MTTPPPPKPSTSTASISQKWDIHGSRRSPETIAGYVGQAAGKRGLAQRFGNYESRAVSPRDQHGKAIPLTAPDDQLGTTSLNARRMLRALAPGAGQTVSVFIIDDPSLADRAVLHWQEKIMIGQLCRSGVVVWNKAGTGGSK